MDDGNAADGGTRGSCVPAGNYLEFGVQFAADEVKRFVTDLQTTTLGGVLGNVGS